MNPNKTYLIGALLLIGVGACQSDSSTPEAGLFVNEGELQSYRANLETLVAQTAMLSPVKPEDVKTMTAFVHEAAKKSEVFASEAADLLADALTQNATTPAGLAEQMYKVSARYQLVGSELVLRGPTASGKPFEVEKLKGKVVIVDVFATWCVPCRVEHKVIKDLYKAHSEEGLEVVAISADEDHGMLDAFNTEHNDPWPTLYDRLKPGKHEVFDAYGITSYPTVFVVGRDGNVVTTLGSTRLPEIIAAELAKKAL